MPYQNIVRWRRIWSRSSGQSPLPPGPNPPLTGLIARYVASMVAGISTGGDINPLPEDGALEAWQPVYGTTLPLTQSTAEEQPNYTTNDDIHFVSFDPGQTLRSAFVPPTGGAPRTIVLLVANSQNGAQRMVGYGDQDDGLGAFDLSTTDSGFFGWRVESEAVAEGLAVDDGPHVLFLSYDGDDLVFASDEGPSDPVPLDLDTTATGLELGSSGGQFAVLEVIVYDHALTPEETDALMAYMDAAYDFGGGGDDGPPEEGLVARYSASSVNGPDGPDPDPDSPVASWASIAGTDDPLEQPEGDARPTFISDGDGRRVRFAAGQSMASLFQPPSGAAARTVALIGRAWGAGAGQGFLGYGDGETPSGVIRLVTTGDGDFGWQSDDTTTVDSSVLPGEIASLLLLTYDEGSAVFQVSNNEPIVTAGVLATAAGGLWVGGDDGAGFDCLEIFVYDRALAGDDYDRLLLYFNEHYNDDSEPALPLDDLAANFMASVVAGRDEGGEPNPLPEDGASLAEWVAQEMESPVVLTQGAPGQRPTYVANSEEAPASVRFAMGTTMSSVFFPPIGSNPRSVVLIGNFDATDGQDLFHSGDPDVEGDGFGLLTLAGQFAWDAGGGATGLSNVATTPGPHAIVLTYTGTTMRIAADGGGYQDTAIGLDTDGDPLTVGGLLGTAAFDLYQLAVYERALAPDELVNVFKYARAAFHTPQSPTPPVVNFPLTNLLARWAADAAGGVDGDGNILPLPAPGALATWAQSLDATGMPPAFQQPVGANQPQFFNDGVEQPYVQFSAGQFMTTAADPPAGDANRTLAIIGRQWTGGTQQTFLHYGDLSTANAAFGIGTGAGGDAGWLGGGGVGGSFGAGPLVNAMHLLVAQYSSTVIPARVTASIDQQAPVENAADLATDLVGHPLTLGNAGLLAGATSFVAYEVFLYGDAMSAEDRAQLEAYANYRYGTPLSP